MAVVHLLLLFVGFSEYGQVHDYHDRTRYPEGYAAAYDSVGLVHHELANVWVALPKLLVLVGGVPTHENRKEADHRRTDPRVEDHQSNDLFGHVQGVLERLDDGVEPIHADAAEMQNGSRGEVNI